jgi:peptide/nickel transport system permease protein
MYLVLVLFVITLVTYLIFYVLPSGDPALRFCGKTCTPEVVAQVKKQFGLDQPLLVQYGSFMKHLFLGDQYGWPGFGFSFDTRSPVREALFSRIWVTLQLGAGAAIFWVLLGVPLGILSALKRRTFVDRATMGFALFGVSAPVFAVGLAALYIFWQKLGIEGLGTGYVAPSDDFGAFLGHMILPWSVLALQYAAFYARMVRSNLLETLGEDYIRTARAKGLSERKVIGKHGLRASLTPVVTIFGMDFSLLIGGAVLTESVFNLPGLGQLIVSSVNRQDIPVVLATTIVAAFFVSVMSLVVDILYGYLDPRVRFS